MISLTHVTKSLGSKRVLQDICLDFADGQTHVLLGSSGCGKSTLLRLILGLTFPEAGHVKIGAIDVGPETQAQIPMVAGYVIQDGGLFPHFTAAQNITLVAKARGWSAEKIKHRLDELSGLMEMETSLLSRYPKQLSGGQKQRVGLMRALMLDPQILLLDEPLGALDPIVRASLQSELKNIFNRLKKTVLIVTHDVGEAAFFGHSITLLNEGRVIQKGTFPELLHNPQSEYVTEFINAQRLVQEFI